MEKISYEREILDALHKLNVDQQRRVLEFAQGLTRPKGEPGWLFLERTRDIHIEPDDLKAMEQAIEEACEQIHDFPEVNLDE